jgi:hypothetical protein
MKDKLIKIRVTEAEHKEISRIAEDSGLTLSALVRQRLFERVTIPVATTSKVWNESRRAEPGSLLKKR